MLIWVGQNACFAVCKRAVTVQINNLVTRKIKQSMNFNDSVSDNKQKIKHSSGGLFPTIFIFILKRSSCPHIYFKVEF